MSAINLNTDAAESMKAATETIRDVLEVIKGLPGETVDVAKATGIQNLIASAESFADVMPVFIKNLQDMANAGENCYKWLISIEEHTTSGA